MKTKKYISLLMAIIMMLSLFAGCGSEGNTPSVSDDKDTLYLRLSSALQSTDWQQTSAMEGNKITYVQLFEGLYGIDESAGGYYNLLAKDIQVSEDVSYLYHRACGCHLPERRSSYGRGRRIQL